MRNKIYFIFLMILLINFTSCSVDYSKKINEIIENETSLKIGKNYKEIINNLGMPISEKIEIEKDSFDNKKENKIISLNYDGIKIKIIQYYDSKNEDVFYIKVDSENIKIKYDLNIGTNIRNLTEQLGSPTEKGNNYYLYEGNLSYIIFYFKNKKIEKIIWRFGGA